MAGRGGGGRGRGRGGHMTFSAEAIGIIGKGEALPTHPPALPIIPTLGIQAASSADGRRSRIYVGFEAGAPGATKNLPYFIKPSAPKKDVERYSDKYQISGPVDNAIEWNPDWKRLPQELKIRVRKLRKQRELVLAPKRKSQLPTEKEETIKKLETLEKKEEEVTSEEEGEEEGNEEGKEEEAEEEYDEEEFEEETDYIMSYFDNGEDFGADSDDNMDEAVY